MKKQNHEMHIFFFLSFKFLVGLSHRYRKKIVMRTGVSTNKNLKYVTLVLELDPRKWLGRPCRKLMTEAGRIMRIMLLASGWRTACVIEQ